MNAGLIASRYAKALLLFANERQDALRVYEDAGALEASLQGNGGDLPDCVRHLSETMQRFLTLVIRNRRTDYLPAILRLYRSFYREDKGITRARLTSASEEPALAETLTQLLKEQGCSEVDFETEVDPALIGGFTVQIEDKRLDASIASQLKHIQKELEANIRKNRKNG